MNIPRYALLVVLLCSCSHPLLREPPIAAQSTPTSALAPSAPADWCDSFAPGAPSGERPELGISAAHATRRFFGIGDHYSPADQALAVTLENQPVSKELNLSDYAHALPETCWLAADTRSTPRIHVELHDGVAWVRPGRGLLKVPAAASAVVLDLRDLPSQDDSVGPALSAILAQPLPLPDARIRVHQGMTDEYFAPRGVYSNSVQLVHQSPLPAHGTFAGPLYVLLGHRLSPAAAELAGALRWSGRAFLIGNPLRVAVAESIWRPVGRHGLAFRVRDLEWNGVRWPDIISADFQETELPNRLAANGSLGGLTSLAAPPTRPILTSAHPYGDVQPRINGRGDIRAALVIAHGALRLFYPDFAEVGDRIDPRLRETLNEADRLPAAPEVREERNLLRRLSEALHDGHSFVFAEPSDPAMKGFLPALLETIRGQAVVRRSAVAELAPGDTILSIAGHSVRDLYRVELARTSASTAGYKYDIANRELSRLTGVTELVVRPAGSRSTKNVTVQPADKQILLSIKPSSPILRASGWLADLNAPGSYYLNLSSDVLHDPAALEASLKEAAGAKRLVVDLRAYPGMDVNVIARRLICAPFSSPVLRFITYPEGPDKRNVAERSHTFEPLGPPSFCGSIALLVGPHSVSAAETLATMLFDARRVTVYGDASSAGSNGNIPGIQLPGSIAFTFSGMEVLHADRSRFVGIGIAPKIPVPVTALDLAKGRDPVLAAAAKGR